MYRKKSEGWMKQMDFLLLDMLCLQLSFLVACLIRHGLENPYANVLYRNHAIILCLCQLIVIFFGESFHNALGRGYYSELKSTVKHTAGVILLSMSYLFATQEAGLYSRIVFFLTGILYLGAGYAMRILWKKHLKRSGIGNKNSLMVVTTLDLAQGVLDNLQSALSRSHQITGLVLLDQDVRDSKVSEVSGIPVIGIKNSAVSDICRKWVDEVFVRLPNHIKLPASMEEAFTEMGITIHLSLTKMAGREGQKRSVQQFGIYTVLTSSIKIASYRQMLYKRLLDIAGGLVGCLLTGLLFLFVAPAIYIKSPGPIFFSQTRIGKGGKTFKLYKFRSMYLDAEERKQELMARNKIQDGFMFKLDYDPRIIGSEKVGPDGKAKGIGNFIRRTSIDEFPQFWNVLKGDMSLVGTRPPTLDEWEKYSPHHRARMSIKPGITGLWQISGRSDIVDFEEVVQLDVEYIENWNIEQDLKILFRTVVAVLRSEGAA